MDHGHDNHGSASAEPPTGRALTRMAVSATAHCLTGCAIGEVLGIVIGPAAGFSNAGTIVLAVILAFVFGYAFTMRGILKAGVALAAALPLAFASDTISIAVMEIVDNLIMVVIPGAMDAGIGEGLFWASLAFSLAVAFVIAVPVNRRLIAKGRGHAVVMQLHDHH